jgi:DNA-binding MurR/RpiR family transcriptional regulator
MMPDKKYLIFTSRLTQAYPNLSASEKQVADYMLAHPDQIADATASSLAQMIGTSTATIIRFSRSCGFSGLTDMKLSLKREYMVLNTDDESKYMDIKRGDSVAMIKQKVLGYHNMVINNMLSSWNEDAYTLAADALINAKRILIFGEGGSRSTALCLFHILSNLGLFCETYMDSVFEIMNVDSMTPDDVLIGISYTGRLRNTVDSLNLAKKRGATTIGLVGFLNTPMIEYVDILLNTTRINKDYYDSALSVRISEMAVIEILSALLAVRLNRAVESDIAEDHIVSLRRITKEEQYRHI